MALPPAERREFRKFLFSLDGSEAPKRKVHSWKRKRKPAKSVKAVRPKSNLRKAQRAPSAQIPLPFDD